ncbi:MAG: hypothetical protein A2W90_00445 [Bacteroidetes bacterium GWF2_42_66]|nr:MAG: hypothetical protein A2W90_00445 [Bacteroidetes bacterium GWF2_42_66]
MKIFFSWLNYFTSKLIFKMVVFMFFFFFRIATGNQMKLDMKWLRSSFMFVNMLNLTGLK